MAGEKVEKKTLIGICGERTRCRCGWTHIHIGVAIRMDMRDPPQMTVTWNTWERNASEGEISSRVRRKKSKQKKNRAPEYRKAKRGTRKKRKDRHSKNVSLRCVYFPLPQSTNLMQLRSLHVCRQYLST